VFCFSHRKAIEIVPSLKNQNSKIQTAKTITCLQGMSSSKQSKVLFPSQRWLSSFVNGGFLWLLLALCLCGQRTSKASGIYTHTHTNKAESNRADSHPITGRSNQTRRLPPKAKQTK
jgi:hypothetical protein